MNREAFKVNERSPIITLLLVTFIQCYVKFNKYDINDLFVTLPFPLFQHKVCTRYVLWNTILIQFQEYRKTICLTLLLTSPIQSAKVPTKSLLSLQTQIQNGDQGFGLGVSIKSSFKSSVNWSGRNVRSPNQTRTASASTRAAWGWDCTTVWQIHSNTTMFWSVVSEAGLNTHGLRVSDVECDNEALVTS